MLTNEDFGNTRGVDVRLDRRIGQIFNGTVSYSYASAKNTGSDPLTYINFGSRIINSLSGGNQPPPQAIAPTNESRPHSLAGAFSVNFPGDWHDGTALGTVLQNVGLFSVFRYASGTAYTKCTPASDNLGVLSGQACGIQSQFVGGYNAARLPAFKQFDIKLTKGFGLGGMDLTTYLQVDNLFNFKNVLRVFINTNDIVDNLNEERSIQSTLGNWQDEATANAIYNDATGDIDLNLVARAWLDVPITSPPQIEGGVPSCIYLRRVEERWGNGDHLFSLDEQRKIAEGALPDRVGRERLPGHRPSGAAGSRDQFLRSTGAGPVGAQVRSRLRGLRYSHRRGCTMHSRFGTRGVLLGGLLALAMAAFAPSVASAKPEPGVKRSGFRLFARSLGAFTINRVYCGISTSGEICVDSTNSSTIGGGFWPKGTGDQYVFNTGLQLAGIIGGSKPANPWGGDTTGAFFFNARGDNVHGQEVQPIYNATNPDDVASWPDAALVPSGDASEDLFYPVLRNRVSASQGDVWLMSWEGDPSTGGGRPHPMGIAVETRGMGWNYPTGNQDIVYLIYTFYNVTSLDPAVYAAIRPSMREILLEKAQAVSCAEQRRVRRRPAGRRVYDREHVRGVWRGHGRRQRRRQLLDGRAAVRAGQYLSEGLRAAEHLDLRSRHLRTALLPGRRIRGRQVPEESRPGRAQSSCSATPSTAACSAIRATPRSCSATCRATSRRGRRCPVHHGRPDALRTSATSTIRPRPTCGSSSRRRR